MIPTEPAARPGSVRKARPRRPLPRPTLLIGIAAAVAITVWAGIQIEFDILPLFEGLPPRVRRIYAALFDPDWAYVWRVLPKWLETMYIAVIAAAIGNAIGLGVAFLASKVTAGSVLYRLTKSGLNVIRALPDVAYGLLFVAAVGTGPLAGILALVLFNIGANAKLTSETIDAVDRGPLEAADAAGANRVQRAFSAVLPQVLPNYASYSIYIFELNIRASAVIGIVGAGGIGDVIQVTRSRFEWERLSAIIVALFLIVFILDRISVLLRRRFT